MDNRALRKMEPSELTDAQLKEFLTNRGISVPKLRNDKIIAVQQVLNREGRSKVYSDPHSAVQSVINTLQNLFSNSLFANSSPAPLENKVPIYDNVHPILPPKMNILARDRQAELGFPNISPIEPITSRVPVVELTIIAKIRLSNNGILESNPNQCHSLMVQIIVNYQFSQIKEQIKYFLKV